MLTHKQSQKSNIQFISDERTKCAAKLLKISRRGDEVAYFSHTRSSHCRCYLDVCEQHLVARAAERVPENVVYHALWQSQGECVLCERFACGVEREGRDVVFFTI